MYALYYYIIHFSSYCIVTVKVVHFKLSLSEWYMLPSFVFVSVRVSFVCPFSLCVYTNTGL
jgi:hypothetical protein